METLNERHGPIGDGMHTGKVRCGFFKPYNALDVISTGSLELDIATGIGGVPRGRIIELFGPPSAGKRTIALLTAACAQKQGLRVQYIDLKNSLDFECATRQGVDTEGLVVTEAVGGDQATDALLEATGSGEFGLVILNSADLMSPIFFVGNRRGISLSNPNNLQRLLNKGLEKLAPIAKQTNTSLIVVNQINTRLPSSCDFGTSASTVLSRYASLRINIGLDRIVHNNGRLLHITTMALVVHNAMALPWGKAHITLTDGYIDQVGDLLVLGKSYGILKELPHDTFTYRGMEIGKGILAAGNCIKNSPGLANQIWEEILSKALNPTKR